MTCRVGNKWCIYGARLRRGMCWRHYNRWYSSPLIPLDAPFPERVDRERLLRLYYAEGLRQREISRILGCHPVTVSRILSHSYRMHQGLA